MFQLGMAHQMFDMRRAAPDLKGTAPGWKLLGDFCEFYNCPDFCIIV